MDINQELMIETKELMDKCKENLMAAFDIFKQLQENPEYMKIVEGLFQEEAKEDKVEEVDENASADCIGEPYHVILAANNHILVNVENANHF